jgi:hypothetical protein
MAGNFKTLFKRVLSRHSPLLRSRGRILKRFADKIGLVYFGTVDQMNDDHEVIRGLTVSTTHQDSHYAVGAYDGYDVSMVDRFDLVVDHEGKAAEHTWLILQIDLQRSDSLPHLFFKPMNHSHNSYDKFFRAFHHLQPVNTLLTGMHSPEFHGRYELYTTASRVPELEEILTALTTQTIATRLWPHAIEVFENKLYVYTTESEIHATLLETGLESALWLARTLDQVED